jgi:hypothetical protein
MQILQGQVHSQIFPSRFGRHVTEQCLKRLDSEVFVCDVKSRILPCVDVQEEEKMIDILRGLQARNILFLPRTLYSSVLGRTWR